MGGFRRMHISGEGKIGIALTLAFGVGGGAAMMWPSQSWIGFATMVLSSAGLLGLGYVHLCGPDGTITKARIAASRRRAAATPPLPETPEQRGERSRREWPAIDVPRIETKSVFRIGDAAELLGLTNPWQVVVIHKMAALTEETEGYTDGAVALLKSEIARKQRDEAQAGVPAGREIVEQMRQALVLLKGNDISVYAGHHHKKLPERWEIPSKPDPLHTEMQLIVAFWPAGEADADSIEVQVDNGQPHQTKAGLYPYNCSSRTPSIPNAASVASKNVAVSVPRLSLLVIDASVSFKPCSSSRRASSA
jgi:hypothetical protein